MIGLDANVLLRWLIDEDTWPEDDPGQTAAVAALLERKSERFYVNTVVLAETLWVLERPMKQKKSALATVMDRLLGASNLTIDCRDALLAARASFEQHRCGINDRLIAELDSRAGCSWTATFDQDASQSPGFRLLHTRGR
jgi:predicted nucleic-acid-binding protein